MSQENVERVREAVDALNRGDVEAALALTDPSVEWQCIWSGASRSATIPSWPPYT